jgi:subtilisin-like proprotein convertase family protein
MSEKKAFVKILASFQILALFFLMSPQASSQRKIKRTLVPETVFSNPANITINTTTGLTAPTKAETYPSDIAVSGMAGNTTRVAVTLNGLTHTNLTQLDFLLVSPSGAKFIFASDMTSGSGIEDTVLSFADDGATTLPAFTIPAPGLYKPTSGDGSADTFPTPAPAGPYNIPPSSTFASSFNGASPNGTWSLYAVDDTLSRAGSLNDGWSLNITTDSTAATDFSNNNYLAINDIVATAAPYGSTINVSGQSGAISNLKVTLTGLTAPLPQSLDILLVSPDGKSSILMSDTGGPAAVAGLNLTFDDAATNVLTNPGNIISSGSYKPADVDSEGRDTFPSPAPYRASTGNSVLSIFNGVSPNGDWKLFVVNDTQNMAGSLTGGWSIDITTGAQPPPALNTCAAPSFATGTFPVGTNPTNMAFADFNNDTNLDLAVTNQVSSDVSILLGDGAGNFGTQSLITAGSSPYAIVAGKFNADSNWDLAVANSASNNVSILLGNGNGTFSAATNFFAGSSPISMAIGDFNNDTKQDLVVANFGGFFSGSVSTLLGNGSGGFTAGNSVRTRTQPSYVLVADINNDTNQDLLVANFGSDSVSSFFGNGSNVFTLGQNVTTGGGPVALELSDFQTPTGELDLAIATYNNDGFFTTHVSNTGVLSGFATNAAGGSNPVSITSGDFIQNQKNDLVIALSGTNKLKLFGADITVGQNPNAVKAIDLNGDTRKDLVSVNSGSNDVSVLISNCIAAKGNLFDYTGDRRTDVSVFRPTGIPAWWIYPSPFPKQLGRGTDTIVPADYDGDRLGDYAFYRSQTGLWEVFANNGQPLYFITFGLPGDIAMPADYDGDGRADIAVFRPSAGQWFVRQTTDHTTAVYTFGSAGDAPVAADYDGDGKADVAVFRPSTGVWYIFRSSDSGIDIQAWGLPGDKTAQGGYDGDGKADIAIWRPSSGSWYVLRSSDAAVQAVNWGLPTDLAVTGDFDGDGKFDYVVWRPSDNIWYILKSSDSSAMFVQWGIATDIPIPGAYVR